MTSSEAPRVTSFGDTVRLEVVSGVATLRLDRPKLNALDTATQQGIRAAAEAAAADATVAAVVLYGGERAFAAGADVKEMAGMSRDEMIVAGGPLQASLTAVAAIPKPVVAAVTGYALGGGCELALCADVRFAADDAKLGQPEILLGVIPGAGGSQRLPRLVGASVAKDLIFTGRMVEADEGLRIGLVDHVLPAAEVYPAAVAWAGQFVGGPAMALAAAKAAVDQGLDAASLAAGLEIERRLFADLFGTEDQALGMTSFVENGPGKARFVGR